MSKNKISRISTNDIADAIEEYKKLYNDGEISGKNESILYDIVYQSVRYPAKFILELAYEKLYNEKFDRSYSSFAIDHLKNTGYEVKQKRRHIFTYLPSNKDKDEKYIGRAEVIDKIRETKKIFHSSLSAKEDFSFVSEEEYTKKYIDAIDGGNDYYSLKNFIYHMNTFSLVLLTTNNETINMILVITGNYKYNPNPIVPSSNHERKVQILWEGEVKIPENSKKLRASEQVYRIDDNQINRVNDILEAFRRDDMNAYNIFKEKLNKSFDYHIEDIEDSKEITVSKSEKVIPLNQILYGPPGTGKTYNTINKALEIILEKEDDEKQIIHEFNDFKLDRKVSEINEILKKKNSSKEERKILTATFDYYVSNERGQIEFVTFHQSYGYEEFVEGIKADLSSDQIKYKLETGAFKKLCQRALVINDTDVFNALSIGLKIPTKTNKFFEISEINDNTIKIINSNNSEYPLNKKHILERIKTKDFEPDAHKSYEPAIAKYLVDKLNNTSTSSRENAENNKNYILIIDEINRGNISKIFGELITLLEDSKRLGNDEAMEAALPYSGERFGVPKNLYIIGTMNTADRSIAPIDTALRRRFEFIEMSPKPEKLNLDASGINLQKLLTAINTRIEYIFDRDHTIGHSYLLNIESLTALKLIFKNNILPLLAEYFYEDWKNIKIVLNEENIDGFIQSKKTNQYLPTNRNGKVLYEFKDIDDLTENDFKRIYGEEIKVVADEQESTS